MWQTQLAVRRGFNWFQPEGSVKYPGVLGCSLPVHKHVFMGLLLLDKCIQGLMHAGTRLKIKSSPKWCEMPGSTFLHQCVDYELCQMHKLQLSGWIQITNASSKEQPTIMDRIADSHGNKKHFYIQVTISVKWMINFIVLTSQNNNWANHWNQKLQFMMA